MVLTGLKKITEDKWKNDNDMLSRQQKLENYDKPVKQKCTDNIDCENDYTGVFYFEVEKKKRLNNIKQKHRGDATRAHLASVLKTKAKK